MSYSVLRMVFSPMDYSIENVAHTMADIIAFGKPVRQHLVGLNASKRHPIVST